MESVKKISILPADWGDWDERQSVFLLRKRTSHKERTTPKTPLKQWNFNSKRKVLRIKKKCNQVIHRFFRIKEMVLLY